MSASTTLASMIEPPLGHPPGRRSEFARIGDPFLQEIGPAARACFEQSQRVLRFDVLTEDDHADLRVGVTDDVGCPDPFVGLGRRHADVGDHDIGEMLVNCRQQLVVVGTAGHDVQVVVERQDRTDALSHEEAVFGDHHSQCHGGSVTGPGEAPVAGIALRCSDRGRVRRVSSSHPQG